MLIGLQNLRALAAYSVVFYHCISRFIVPATPLERIYFHLPGAGVDLFFVISGFIMVHTTRDDERPMSFIAKRVSRIVPLYWVATMLVVTLVAFRPWTFADADIRLESIVASLLFIPHPDLAGQFYPVLGVGWTLNYEMVFYLAFAASLFFRPTWRLTTLIGCIGLVWLAGISAGGVGIAQFYGNSLIFEFVAGAAIAHLLRLRSVSTFVQRTPMWPFTLIALGAFLVIPLIAPLDTSQLFRERIPAMLLVFAIAGQDMYRKSARQGLFARLGDASYSAYLLHPIVIMFVGLGIDAVMPDGAVAAAVFTVGTLLVTALISLVSMKYFERPTARYLRHLASGKRRKDHLPSSIPD